MYARNLSLRLKANKGADFTRQVENDVLPLLRKQDGFKDEITFLGADNRAVAISLWDNKEHADAYGRDTYPKVLKTMEKMVEGTPKLDAYEVSNSTWHRIAAHI